ncbi:response regulator transcription factor [Thioclava sp. BHET1]|nr:response regulator transcription factor [Thioclava sp. BHET1]
MRVLLVEDHDDLAELIMDRFRADGHAIDRERDGAEAERLLRHARFDLVILDINLPGMTGDALLREIRARGDTTPVLVLTARSAVGDRIGVLDYGADDYMVKPFDFGELAARCRALLRRRSGAASNVFEVGGFSFDRGARRASQNGVDLELRARELQVLEALLGNIDRLVSKEGLADRVYSYDETPSLNALEQTITRLRRKLEGTPLTIRSVRGLGYILGVADG